jgi:hypothetical protein
MDPQPTCPQPAPPSPLPLALKLFVLFASCFSFGAGVGLTLWIIPDHSLAHIYRVVSHGAHIAISTTVATPCEASAQVPCEDPKPQPSPDATDQEKPHTPEVVTPEQPVPGSERQRNEQGEGPEQNRISQPRRTRPAKNPTNQRHRRERPGNQDTGRNTQGPPGSFQPLNTKPG